MALKLGELLIKHNLITQTDLEEALQAQVIFGGKLGTILIEMNLISEKTLASALAKLLSIPCAQPGELERIPENVIATLSAELAEKHQAVPMALSGRKLKLAMAEPSDLKAVDEIAFRTGYIVVPVLALEVRLVLALERYYNIKRTMRYIAAPKKVRDELNVQQTAKKEPENPLQDIALENQDGPKSLLEEAGIEDDDQHIEQRPIKQSASKTADIEEDLIEDLTDEEVTLEETARALIEVRDRNDVAEVLINYLGAHFSRAALFMVVGGMAAGWRAIKNGGQLTGFEEFQVPLNEPSVLKTAVDSQSFFLGPVPQSGANLALTALLGKPTPTTAILLPMIMQGRVVGVIYVDDPEVNLAEVVTELQQLSNKALMAFEVLILHNKILRV